MAKPTQNIVGIDIGSSKVGVLIGAPDGAGGLEVVGMGSAPNRGTRRGNIVNMEATVEALKQATDEAEVMAGVEVSRAYVGMAGVDIKSVNSRGMVSVSRKDREITAADIKRVLEAAQSAALPSDREILHAIPQEFIVDDQGGISEPLNMLGSRLEVNVHLVTGHVTRGKTLLTCVNRAGIEVIEMVFEPLATADAVLTPDEKELGTLLIDIGSGTCGYGLFAEGEVQHSGVIPVGASHFTNDLAQVLKTPFAEAERLKIRSGCCLGSLVDDDEGIRVPSVGGGGERVIPRQHLCEILQARAEELLGLIQRDLERVGRDGQIRGGIVMTGGGAALVGLTELAGLTFDTPVRGGLPRDIGGLIEVLNQPTWSTAAGLLLYGQAAEQADRRSQRSAFSMRSMVGRFRGVFADLL